jgi:drug/metabolite transporter (DMT)-like permease
VLTAVVSLIHYGYAVEILGASSGAAFAAICPVLTALFGVALLEEIPSAAEWLAIVAISRGVYLHGRAVAGPPCRVTNSMPAAAVRAAAYALSVFFDTWPIMSATRERNVLSSGEVLALW